VVCINCREGLSTCPVCYTDITGYLITPQ
jgi:hypothetical protein